MNHVWSSGTLKLEALMCEKNVSESHVEKGVMLLRCMRVCVCVCGVALLRVCIYHSRAVNRMPYCTIVLISEV